VRESLADEEVVSNRTQKLNIRRNSTEHKI